MCTAAYEPNNKLNHKVRIKTLFALQSDLVVEFQNGIDSAAFLEKFEYYTSSGSGKISSSDGNTGNTKVKVKLAFVPRAPGGGEGERKGQAGKSKFESLKELYLYTSGVLFHVG